MLNRNTMGKDSVLKRTRDRRKESQRKSSERNINALFYPAMAILFVLMIKLIGG